MISLVKLQRSLLAGILAAVAGWLVFLGIYAAAPSEMGWGLGSSFHEQMFATIFGLLLGLFLGIAEGLNAASSQRLARATVTFSALGAAGGLVGIYFGQIVYGTLRNPEGPGNFGGFILQLFARSAGWGLWGVGTGMALGIALGIVTGSQRRLVLASIGGILGGALGGFFYELTGAFSAFLTNQIQTLIAFALLAGGIALLSALAQELFKQAWVRVMVGRGEGREHMIDKPVTVIGRDELADVPLFGDQQIARRHVVIEQRNSGYFAAAAEPGLAFAINGQMVGSSPLTDGDLLRIGSRELEFHEKSSARRAGQPGMAQQPGMPGPGVPQQPQVDIPAGACPYCGEMKDAAGNCACTVGAAAGGVTQMASPPSDPTAMAGAPAAPAGGFQPSPAGGGQLEIISGPMAGRIVQLSEGQSIGIGREPAADLAFTYDTTASRQHAQLALRQGMLVVHDMGSTNGTFVNGQRITERAVSMGDIITIGQTQLRVIQ